MHSYLILIYFFSVIYGMIRLPNVDKSIFIEHKGRIMSSHSYKPDSYSDLASERIFESTIKKYRVLDSIQLIEYVKIVEIYLKQSSDSILFRRILLEDKYDVQVITVKLDNRMCVGHLFFQIPKAANKQLRKEYFSHGPVFESAFLYESFRVIYNERSNSITKYWLSGEEKN